MKSFIAPTYTFTPGASGVGTVNLSGISGFDIKYLVSIINQTKGEIVYSTASTSLRYTNVTGTTVTLFKDTSSMSSGDVLQVIYEVQSNALPTGASTEAKQDTGNSSLASVDGKLTTLNAKDFSTSAKQDTGNTSLSNIDTKTPALVSGKVPVDTGLSPLTDSQLRATAVPVSGTVTANTGLSQPLTDAQLRASAVPVTIDKDRETLSVVYSVITAFTGASIGDVISATHIYDVSGASPTLVTSIWRNETLNTTLGSAPLLANLNISLSLTNSELRASAVSVAPNVTRGSGTTDANTQRVTLATDGQVVTDIGSINTKTPALDNSKQPVIPSMTSGGNLSVTTAATGTNWTAFASQALKQLTVSNQTGTNIEFRQGGAGVGLIIPAGAIFTFFGITNANQIEARRVDTSNTQVTITARWES